MNKKQIAVIKESIKVSPRVAYSQYKEFTKADRERARRAKQSARLVNIFK